MRPPFPFEAHGHMPHSLCLFSFLDHFSDRSHSFRSASSLSSLRMRTVRTFDDGIVRMPSKFGEDHVHNICDITRPTIRQRTGRTGTLWCSGRDLVAIFKPARLENAHAPETIPLFNNCFFTIAVAAPICFNSRKKMHYVIFSD